MAGRDLTLQAVLRRSDRLPYRIIESELVAVDVDAREIVHLDPIATWIVQQLDGKRTLGEVLAAILDDYEIDEGTACADLLELVGPLLDQGFLDRVSDTNEPHLG